MLASKSSPTTPQLIFYAKIDDHGVRPGDMGQILARWQHPVPSKVALDMLHRVMRSALHRRIVMVTEMAHAGGIAPAYRHGHRNGPHRRYIRSSLPPFLFD
jgi:hypothetical protein